MVWKRHLLHKIWPHHVKEREIFNLHWKFEVLTPRRSVRMKFYILLVLKVWTELIRSSDDHRSYFLLSGSQDFADFLGKKIQFVQFTKMRISHEPFELHPWFFARKQTLPREIRRKNLAFWRLVQPAQPAQPTYQMKKWKSGITFEWVGQFGWNFAWKLLKRIYITSMKKSLAEQIFIALPN